MVKDRGRQNRREERKGRKDKFRKDSKQGRKWDGKEGGREK